MKKLEINSFFDKFKNVKFFKKFNYDIDRVIGVKDNERYILFFKKKLIRIYRDKLKSAPLLCSYIPIENAIFYSFETEKNVIENVDLDSFVETKVYEEAGLLETEEYIIKYEVVKNLKEEKKVVVQCVIVPVNFILKNYEYIVKETDYIDYLSFPAFAYKSLYQENILKRGNDLFIVMLFDKIFFTFYSEGELIYLNTVSGGLNKVYESLKSLKIADFDFELFKKLLTKKGLNKEKYKSYELPVLRVIKKEFKNYSKIIENQILDLVSKYEIEDVDRIFIITEYGKVPGIKPFYENELQKPILGFDFYEKYNLDKLPVNPFLFLSMIETHHAYKSNNLKYNFSLFLRKPTIFYRPSGILILVFILSLILFSIYPIYLWIDGYVYNSKSKVLENEIKELSTKISNVKRHVEVVNHKITKIKKQSNQLSKEIKVSKNFIESLYKFKFSYLPKSQELVNITLLLNKNKVYLSNLDYEEGIYILNVYSYDSSNLGKLVNDLINNGFNVYFSKIEKKNNKYYTTLRIEE